MVNPSGTPRLEISRNNNSNLCGGEANDTVTREDDEVVYLSGCETGAGIIELRREADNSFVRTYNVTVAAPASTWDPKLSPTPSTRTFAVGGRGEPESGAAADARHLPAAWHQPEVAGAPGLSLPAAECQDHPAQPEPAPAKSGGSQFTSLEFTQVLQDRGVRISMDGQGRYQDNIFVERQWRTMMHEEVYLKAYASVLEAQKALEDYFRFYNGLRPHQALGYRTPAEVFYGEQEAVEGDSSARRYSPEKGTQSLAGEPGFSLNSALILSK